MGKLDNNDANPTTNSSQNFDPKLIEQKWQKQWQEKNIYHPKLDSAKKSFDKTSIGSAQDKHDKFYNLMMFPYPSAEGLHVGNMYAFTGSDIYGRFKRMQGNDVLEPIGLDGFGIHSENYAIKVGRSPQEHARISEENFYRQLSQIGNGFDWERKVETYDPNYYKWTQWLFIQLFTAGLAYRKKAAVNWCPSCKTVLADEQVIDGACERCGSVVEKRELEQWFFKITQYADRLLKNIESLDWSEKVKIAQRNWIGKKEGITITYTIDGSDKTVSVFTTRPDTNFGATFIAIAPEHPLALELTTPDNKEAVKTYLTSTKQKSDVERQVEGREKTGVFTGSYAINQLTGKKMPIWISDFVLMGFGTGALVGVPGHDKRDFEFARKFNLEVIRVVIGSDGDVSPIENLVQVQEKEGKMVNSGFLDGLNIHDATEKIMDYMEEKGQGKRTAIYHLRDWLISRQRYWGPPIPMVYCQACHDKGQSWFTTAAAKEQQVSRMKYLESSTDQKMPNTKYPAKGGIPTGNDQRDKILNTDMAGWYSVPQDQLPVILPELDDWKPRGTGKSPLAQAEEWVKTTCPNCGGEARRETDVSDSFLDSSWYFLRYMATDWDDMPFPSVTFAEDRKSQASNPKESENWKVKIEDSAQRAAWLPVDQYIGGAEHSVLHLLYARFVTMALHDLGYLNFDEPFTRFYAHGLLIKDGAKMSKSKGNVIVPDIYISKFGADTLRTYLMFLGPFGQGGDFRDTGIEGINKYLKRVWKLLTTTPITDEKLSGEDLSFVHQTIKDVTEDLEAMRYNTAIAKLMTYYNYFSKKSDLSKESVSIFLRLLAPFAPHMTEELWERIGESFSIHTSEWPVYEKSYFHKGQVAIVVQIDGKVRDTLLMPAGEYDQSAAEAKAKESEKVQKFLEGKIISKVIYVPNKVLSFVTAK